LSIEDDIIFIERVPTLRMLGRDALRILAIGAESRYVHKGEVLFLAGDIADCSYVIQEGSFRLETTSKLVADVFVGVGTLIVETKRPATATANEPSTVMRISRHLFLKMLEGYPHVAFTLRDQITARAQQAVIEMTDARAMFDTSPPTPT
jgi:CRP-like cAMP-binding protein